MKIIDTSQVTPTQLTAMDKEWVYNGLDCLITYELFQVLHPQLDNVTAATYRFSKDLQGPVLEMRLRGVLVDQARRSEVLEAYHLKLMHHEAIIERYAREGVGLVGFNWRSPEQLKELLYGRLGVPPIRNRGTITVDRNALEKMEAYTVARPIIAQLGILRDLAKKISVLKTEIDTDGRIRTSYNIGGTNSGRLSSSLSEFGTGGNLQNIEELLRSVLIADPGMKMGYFDAEQGESRVVGGIEYNLFGDSTYLDACEGGDLHTTVAKLVWPQLAWTGNPENDKKLAEQPYYRHYSRRFMCKKIGHGTNYKGQPPTIAHQTKIAVPTIVEFQRGYFKAFPAHLRWHEYVENEILRKGYLVNLTRRRREFWGRRNDPETIRSAVSYDPQGSLADIVNQGGLKIWRKGLVQILMQVHDAWVFQYPEEMEEEIIPKIRKLLEWAVPIRDRQLIIPYGCKTGWNFGEYCCGDRKKCPDCKKQTNISGLKEWKGQDKRTRPKEVSILDRPFC